MYTVKNNLAPSCLSRLFKTKNSQYCLRNWDFEIPRFNTTGYGKHTIRYQGPYIWSKLSKKLRSSPTLAIFKTRISKLDLSDLFAVVSKQAGDCRSSAGYLIVCRRLLWLWQSARDKQSWRCFLSANLWQHSNSTLNFAAIIHTQKVASVVKKTRIVHYILCHTHLRFVAKWPGQPRLGVW